MGAAIGEPFLLSNYGTSSSSASVHRNIFVTHERSNSSSKKEGFATVTVNGDGVHILNVSDLHITSSYTFGPSTTFAGPAVSCLLMDDGTKFRRVYAIIEQSPGVKTEDHGRTVWMWDETQTPDSNERAQEKKSSIAASHRVSRIYVPQDLSNYIILLSPDGDVTTMDIDLATQKAAWGPCSKLPLLTSYMFSRVSATFMPVRPVAPLASLVLLFAPKGLLQVCVLYIYEGEIKTALDESIPVNGTAIEASCSASGYISCLQSDGQWRSFELSLTQGSLSLVPFSSPLTLTGFSFIENTSETVTEHHYAGAVSTLSLGSSLVLLCGNMIQSQDLVLLLWDLRYSVVLASHSFPIPVNLSALKGGISLELIPAHTQVFLSVSRPLDKALKSKKRSVVLVVPITVPLTSTIANAFGRASSSARWLAKPESPLSGDGPNTSLDPGRHGLLNKLRSAVNQDRPEAADSAFFEWFESHLGSVAIVDKRHDDNPFGHGFVQEVLNIVLQSSKPAPALYPTKTLYYLLENRFVSAGMFPQSLLGRFLESKDWHAVELAFKTIPDLPEVDIINVLRAVVESGPPFGAQDIEVDAMQSDTPALSSILAACVIYPASDAALRLAMREQLNRAESIESICLILEANVIGIDNESAGVVAASHRPEEAGIPPLDKILAFLRAILDATFVTLLQHTRSHKLLQSLSLHLQSELEIISELQLLHGPLELFAKAQEKMIFERQRPPAHLEDWRRRRKLAHARASMGVDLYQVEELVI
ncbi:hypothetical protein B0F90DRAFT_1684935 [Multifurca ochricompacta]|uniref:Utp8 C-terminal domain-containing protein n=1 Tax=Multifurca ochricompacta TaxID=376703 RepID=A0AAD4MB25_9AGAM|nr:hypothetical protein B0F90DRAFT_1684935 [Multifurca ochricompacta]